MATYGGLNKAWNELTAKQKEQYGSRSDFKSAKDENRQQQQTESDNANRDLYKKNYSGLSDDQRAEVGSRSDYRQARDDWRQDVRNRAGGMDSKTDAASGKSWQKQLVDKEYEDMGKRYRNRVNEDEFTARQDAQRMAGEALAGGKTADELRKGAYDVENLADFDLRATGGGGLYGKRGYYDGGDDDGSTNKLGKGAARLSTGDIRGLKRAGATKEELVAYGQQIADGEIDGKVGGRAQKLLNKYKSELTNTETEAETETEGTTTTTTTTAETGGGTTGGGSTGGGGSTDGEQTDDTLTGGGLNPITGGSTVPGGGIGNTSGDNTQEGQVNQVGAGSVNTGGNEQNTDVDFGNDDTRIDGNNNTVDNSERYYGGDQNNMSIVYGDGATPYNTAPLSDLTTLGYGKPSDSPSKQAQFVDFYQDLNRQAQQDYRNTGTDTAYKFIQNAAATNPIDYVDLNKGIAQQIQNHYDKATEQSYYYMGDGFNYVPPTYQMPDPPKPIESNVEGIADEASDRIDDD